MISLVGWDGFGGFDFDGVAKNDESFVCAGLATTFRFFVDLVVAENEEW